MKNPLFSLTKFSIPMRETEKNGKIFEFGNFRLIPVEELLLKDGKPVALSPKAFRVLTLLVERHGHLVQKSDIIDLVWDDSFVEEGVISRAIWLVRNTLGDTAKEKFIRTVPRRGYRFVYPVSIVADEPASFRLPHTPAPEVGNGSAKAVSISIPEVVSERQPVAPPIHFAERLRSRAVLVGLAGIVVITVLLGYYGFIRRSSAVMPRSIVVLPVAPIAPADRSDLYALGIADSLINRLASAEGLLVRPLSSVRDYAETTKDPVTVGREQKTDYVLTSTYQVADGKIKVTAQLYNVQSGAAEYTLQKQTSTTDLFKAQDEIAADFGSQLMQRFGVASLRSVKTRGTNNEQAYLAYLQGMILLDNWTSDEKDSPLASFDRAVSLDPNYAVAWGGKAMAHSYAGFPEHDRGGEHYKKAREAIDRALYLDQNESLAYTALCSLRLFYEWDYAGAEEAGRRAVELDPTSPFARSGYAMVLTARERFDQGVDQMKKAIEMEPTSVSAQEYYANALYMARRFEEAETQYKGVVAIKPDRKATYWWLVPVMEAQGKEAEAVDWTVKLMAIENKGDEAIQRYRAAYERGGYKEALFERINQKLLRAAAYVQLGDKDKAFEGLENQYQRHSYHLAVFGIVDPQFDPLRSDPRWADLERRVRGE